MSETWGPIPPIVPRRPVDPRAPARIAARAAGGLWLLLAAWLILLSLFAAAVSVSAFAVLGLLALVALGLGTLLFRPRTDCRVVLASLTLSVVLTSVAFLAVALSSQASRRETSLFASFQR